MAKAEELRRQGNEAERRSAFVEAIQLYTKSIRECPGSICLTNRAQANLKLGRFSLAYVDGKEALKLNPRNEKAKKIHDETLERMGMGQEEQKQQLNVDNLAIADEEAFNPSWPKNLQISALDLSNDGYPEENMVGLVPENVMCIGAGGGRLGIPLCQLEQFLNEHVDGPVSQFAFEFVKFDEPFVQMLRRVKRERFGHMSIWWENSDFSRISEESFRFLLDELFSPKIIHIAHWIGMPAGFNYNTLFKLKVFRDAEYIDYSEKIEPDSPNFNLHLDSNMLIDFLHSPGFRRLNLIDGQFHDGFDSFLDRLIHRFNEDTESRSCVLDVLVLNVTDKTKERLKLGEPLIVKHPKNGDELKCTLKKAVGVCILHSQPCLIQQPRRIRIPRRKILTMT